MADNSIKMFDIRTSDIRRSKALHYKNVYTFLNDVGKVVGVDQIYEDAYLYFTRTNNRFELQLIKKHGSGLSRGDLVTYTLLNNKAIAIIKDPAVKGDLIWLDKSDIKENEDGSVTVFKKTGLCLVQKEKFFGYNLSSEIRVMNSDKETKLFSDHIYGFGKILK